MNHAGKALACPCEPLCGLLVPNKWSVADRRDSSSCIGTAGGQSSLAGGDSLHLERPHAPALATVISHVIVGIAVLLIVATALPFVPSKQSWIRIWDFPRTQLAFLLEATLLAGLFVLPLATWRTEVLLGTVVFALGWQLWRIWPYTPLHTLQVGRVWGCPEDSTIKLLICNVLMGNRDSGALMRLINSTAPDIVLLVETDEWWDAQLEGVASYPHAVRHPKGNTYGMHFLSKFPLEQPQVRYLLNDDIPSIKAGARLPCGRTVAVYCVHPRPPPRADTAQRDAELVMIGREIRPLRRACRRRRRPERRRLVAHHPSISSNQRTARPPSWPGSLFHFQRALAISSLAARSRFLQPGVSVDRSLSAAIHRLRSFSAAGRTLLPARKSVNPVCSRT